MNPLLTEPLFGGLTCCLKQFLPETLLCKGHQLLGGTSVKPHIFYEDNFKTRPQAIPPTTRSLLPGPQMDSGAALVGPCMSLLAHLHYLPPSPDK